ncbi:putative methylmalonyl-CoA mutase, mitochondrial [Toxocara canis]|uniref:Putative methylmalonyl-CoA mutase, mitochondrial n=1 Tax=Toxocara canis TaxID=6265 RepID=A0A0B2V6B5_TOXCA|nr:putative methylmalonyl-CoA mutase, mitochondrial [Toxocara canis]
MLRTFLCTHNYKLATTFVATAGTRLTSKNFLSTSLPHNETVYNVLNRVKLFAQREGRQPRVMVSRIDKNGLNVNPMGHAIRFADLGFDVDVCPDHLSAEETAQQSVNADVHVVVACNLATEYLVIIPALRKELNRLGRSDILVIANGMIPNEDHDALYEAGISAIFCHESDIPNCALQALDELESMLPKDDDDSTACPV